MTGSSKARTKMLTHSLFKKKILYRLNSLNPRSRTYFEKLIFPQVFEKVLAFYGIQKVHHHVQKRPQLLPVLTNYIFLVNNITEVSCLYNNVLFVA
jgi:hypothetical protein